MMLKVHQTRGKKTLRRLGEWRCQQRGTGIHTRKQYICICIRTYYVQYISEKPRERVPLSAIFTSLFFSDTFISLTCQPLISLNSCHFSKTKTVSIYQVYSFRTLANKWILYKFISKYLEYICFGTFAEIDDRLVDPIMTLKISVFYL